MQFNTAANTFSRHHGSLSWEDNLFLRFCKVVKEKGPRKDTVAGGVLGKVGGTIL